MARIVVESIRGAETPDGLVSDHVVGGFRIPDHADNAASEINGSIHGGDDGSGGSGSGSGGGGFRAVVFGRCRAQDIGYRTQAGSQGGPGRYGRYGRYGAVDTSEAEE